MTTPYMIWVSWKDCDAPLKTFILSSTDLFSQVLLLFVAFPFLFLSIITLLSLFFSTVTLLFLSFIFFSYSWCSFFLSFFLSPLNVGIESLFYRQRSENGGLFSQPFLAAHAPPLSILQAGQRYMYKLLTILTDLGSVFYCVLQVFRS
jgi:hypothetical protein